MRPVDAFLVFAVLISPVTPLLCLLGAGLLLRNLYDRRGSFRLARLVIGLALVLVAVVLGPFLAGGSGIFGPLMLGISVAAMLCGAASAAILVWREGLPRKRLVALFLAAPLVYWAALALRDTLPQDQAAVCAVQSMVAAIEAYHSANGRYPDSLATKEVGDAYYRILDTNERQGCLGSWDNNPLYFFVSFPRLYAGHLFIPQWEYRQLDGTFFLAYRYTPLRLAWLGDRRCTYHTTQGTVRCAPHWF